MIISGRLVRWASMVVAAAVNPVSGGFALAQAPGGRQMPPPAVVIEKVEVLDASNPAEFIGRVEAIESVDIRARVQGFVRSVNFQAGQTIKAGDLLFEIEPAQYQASAASAQAQLDRAGASRKEAENRLARTRELIKRDAAAQATLDEAQAAFDIATADVKVAEAALRNAELNLSYTSINAPIAGQIGRAAYTQGNLVGPESNVLARIVQLDPIRVVFSVTEGLVVTLRQQGTNGGKFDVESLTLALRLPNGTDYPHPGRIEYADSEVNPKTGTVAVRLVFPNPDRILIPNQSVTVVIRDKQVLQLPVVPQSAVLQDRQGRFVYVLGGDNKVAQQRIETGARVANGWAVTKGLKGGEQVVVQGIQRLADGMTVQPSQGQPVGAGR